MEIKKLSKKVDKVFTECFGKHPLRVRLDDITNEFYELIRFRDKENLKEEAGDLLSSIFQLCNESGWNPETLIDTTLKKINRRKLQYKTLKKRYRVAILGGAFDPITKAHVQVAEFVLNSTKLFDEVWIMPAYANPLKKNLVPYKHRIKMCELATSNNPKIKIFDYPLNDKLHDKTYHVFDKLLKDKLYESYDFHMIIGLDHANDIDKWYNHKKLLKMLNFVVVPRKGIKRNKNIDWYLNKPHIFLDFENQLIECSSTEVRKLVKEKNFEDIKKFEYLNENVLQYIRDNNLYK